MKHLEQIICVLFESPSSIDPSYYLQTELKSLNVTIPADQIDSWSELDTSDGYWYLRC